MSGRHKPNRHENIESRKKLALENQEARAKRSPQEQLAVLDRTLGAGVGAVKERIRLQKLISS